MESIRCCVAAVGESDRLNANQRIKGIFFFRLLYLVLLLLLLPSGKGSLNRYHKMTGSPVSYLFYPQEIHASTQFGEFKMGSDILAIDLYL